MTTRVFVGVAEKARGAIDRLGCALARFLARFRKLLTPRVAHVTTLLSCGTAIAPPRKNRSDRVENLKKETAKSMRLMSNEPPFFIPFRDFVGGPAGGSFDNGLAFRHLSCFARMLTLEIDCFVTCELV